MNSPRDTFRLHDLVDGVLSPRERSELLAGLPADAALSREYRAVRALHALLDRSLDEDPPADLTLRILEGVREDRARRARLLRLPGWAENALVFGGAVSLASLVAVGRVLGVGWAVPWLGRLTVGAADAVEVAKTAAIHSQGLDWSLRLLGTLSEAGWTVLGSSAPLLVFGVGLSLTMGLLTAWVLSRQGRLVKGGAGHAHLLA